jgi:hypothetical protein
MAPVTYGQEWNPAQSEPPPRARGRVDPKELAKSFVPTPFQRLTRVHALMVACDAVVAIAMAGSLFFDVDPASARGKVALYLLFTMAPFAVVSPLVGPVLDRMAGGRRLAVFFSAAVRIVVCLLMAAHIDSLLLYPEAFLFLVFSKTYAVSKSALVPTTVTSDEELVEANSKLGVVSGVVGVIAAVPALTLKLIDPAVPLLLAAALSLVAAIAAIQLPRSVVAAHDALAAEKLELRSTGILLAASAMGLLRATVGFLTFHIAFWLRGASVAALWFGVILLLSAAGTMAGNLLGPQLRKRTREEVMLVIALAITGVAGVLAALGSGRFVAALLAGCVGLSAAVGKLAFDSIVQRDAPDANRGRAFAQFEARFQLAWVMAAAVPVIIPIPGWAGFLIVGGLAIFAMVSYIVGARRLQQGRPLPEPITTRARRGIRRRFGRAPTTGPAGARGPLPPPEAAGREPSSSWPAPRQEPSLPPGPVREGRRPR